VVDSHVVVARIDKIRDCVSKLRVFADLGEDAFIEDSAATDGAKRNMQITIQSAIDIGNHVVADMDLGRQVREGAVPLPSI
jgi:uncharacterized protein YutE (UPF0331/DUF86 family)